MKEKIIKSAEKIINESVKANVAVAVIDDNGFPNASTYMIAKADGIKWLTFCTSLSRDIVKKIRKNNKASVCINSNTYNFTLVGRFEILTDSETKKDNWHQGFEAHWSSFEAPEYCVLKFTTERYNLFDMDVTYEVEAKGTIENTQLKQ